MADSFRGVLESWVDTIVTVVNPESFKSTALGKGLQFQSYPAKLASLGEDILKLTFAAKKGESETTVEQIVPIDRVKRVSIWGEEKIIHL